MLNYFCVAMATAWKQSDKFTVEIFDLKNTRKIIQVWPLAARLEVIYTNFKSGSGYHWGGVGLSRW